MTPIKHVIVIIGENRTFDHVYATYTPKQGETVSNLLSKGIVRANGKPGPNNALSAQFSALDNTASGGTFSASPQSKSIYNTLPPALAGGPSSALRLRSPTLYHSEEPCAPLLPNVATGRLQY
jgi:phospholipase C